ncbi:uncharacterized protein LOC129585492 [Paramacrobiotus metropolitanus]|uniref:uncharacterized protein LOC129585492 n=1 Tax=Paramacrobiotus metropolitanus TaxID=2943436 RepID=UPI002445C84F|nr:uncharacterized protein LOC129585492 [Paramacrobiotus metropolitanus]
MLVYGDEDHRVYAWNAVVVLMKGNKLKHGHVINKAEGGLIIDFGCERQRARFIEYGRLAHCIYHDFMRPTDEAQVLLRSPTTGAWVWYPGQVVGLGAYRLEKAEVVEVQLPKGRTIRELLPMDQVRRPPPRDYLRSDNAVRKEHFMIRSCTLPDVSWDDESHWLREVFQREMARRFPVVCTALRGSKVHYLQDGTKVYYMEHDKYLRPVNTLDMINLYRWAKNEEKGGFSSASSRWVLRDMASSLDSGQQKSGKRRAMPLPVELLAEVIQSLDSIERFRCRRVCPLWNAVLTIEANFPVVRVSGKDGAYSNRHFRNEGAYWVSAGLLKCLSSRTRVVVITGLNIHESTDLVKIVKHNRNEKRLPMLEFRECCFGNDHDIIDDILDETVKLMLECLACCDRILWKQCRIVDRSLTAPVAQLSIGVPSSFTPLKRQLWELVEYQKTRCVARGEGWLSGWW